jgi:hypothetical protein
MILEAVGGKRVSMRPWSVYLDHHAHVDKMVRVDWPVENLERSWKYCSERWVDTPYAWWQLPGDAICETVEALGGDRPRNPFAQKSLVCSELAWDFVVRAGIPGFVRFDRNTVSPQDLDDQFIIDAGRFIEEATLPCPR